MSQSPFGRDHAQRKGQATISLNTGRATSFQRSTACCSACCRADRRRGLLRVSRPRRAGWPAGSQSHAAWPAGQLSAVPRCTTAETVRPPRGRSRQYVRGLARPDLWQTGVSRRASCDSPFDVDARTLPFLPRRRSWMARSRSDTSLENQLQAVSCVVRGARAGRRYQSHQPCARVRRAVTMKNAPEREKRNKRKKSFFI